MWTHVPGEHGSSTRMEVAAGVLALHPRKPVNIGSDSKCMVDKAKWLIAAAFRCSQMQWDGDLWRWFWRTLRQRGPSTVPLRKLTVALIQNLDDADDRAFWC